MKFLYAVPEAEAGRLRIHILAISMVFGFQVDAEADSTRGADTMNSIHLVDSLVWRYSIEKERLPTEEEGLSVLVPKYLKKEITDSWGTPLRYTRKRAREGRGFGIYSLGKDRVSESGGDDTDDLNSWNPDMPWADIYYPTPFFTFERLVLIGIVVAFLVYGGFVVRSIARRRRM